MAIAELFHLLQQDPAGTHTLFPPVESAIVSRAEKILGRRLPLSYVRFLALSNGAVLFQSETVLGLGPSLEADHDLIRQRELLLDQGMPRQLIPFGPTEDGVDCFDGRARPVEGELPVVFWSREDGIGEASHESFDEWLFELSESLRDGPPNLETLDDHTRLDDDAEADSSADDVPADADPAASPSARRAVTSDQEVGG